LLSREKAKSMKPEIVSFLGKNVGFLGNTRFVKELGFHVTHLPPALA
jgi:hypothetical protein